MINVFFFFFSSRRRHTRLQGDWSSDVCSSDLPDGDVHDVSGAYREVVANKKLVYTWAWKSTPERESIVTIELRAAGSGTELTLKHEQFADSEARDRHQQGWMGCLARLEKAVA